MTPPTKKDRSLSDRDDLQQPEDEQPADPLDVSAMTREQRDALKRKILAQHPHLVEELTG